MSTESGHLTEIEYKAALASLRKVGWEVEERQRYNRLVELHFRKREAGHEPPRPADALSVREAARRLQINPRRIWSQAHKQNIRIWGTEKHLHVSLDEVRRYVREEDGQP
jgi:hypothetical protein